MSYFVLTNRTNVPKYLQSYWKYRGPSAINIMVVLLGSIGYITAADIQK